MARPIVVLNKDLKANFEQCPSPRLHDVLKEFYEGSVFVNKSIKNAIYLQIIEHIRCFSKKSKIRHDKNFPLVVHHSEGDSTYFQNVDYIEKRGTFLHSSYNLGKGKFFNYWMYDYLLSRKKFQFNFSKKIDLPARFLCLNGRPEVHRYFVLQCLQDVNIFKKGLISFLNRYNQIENYNIYQDFKEIYKGNSLFIDNLFDKKLQLKLDKTNNEIHEDDRSHEDYLYQETSISLVTETYADNRPGTFITEKSWKPIANMHLPIWIAQKNIVQSFREMNFDVFDDIIDQSYDTIDNSVERWTRAVISLNKLLTRLENTSEYDKRKLLYRLEKNQSRLLDAKISEKEILEWVKS